jgi:FkbM family methyltransferase
MLNVACVWSGDAFGVEYVERLLDMLRRNLPSGFPGRFVVLTDRPGDLSHLDVEVVRLTESLPGWWAKLLLFKPDTFRHGERVWFFDLDTVIAGPLESLFAYAGPFAALQDVYRGAGTIQSSVMSWQAGTPQVAAIWEEWNAHGRPLPHGGDQAVLEMHFNEWLPKRLGAKPWPPEVLQQLFPGRLRSYKQECVWAPPPKTSVVFFHGHPRPHEVQTGWVPEVWKVGGTSLTELVSVGTIDAARMRANVEHNLKREAPEIEPAPSNDKLAVICAGGPSLKDHLTLIHSLQAAGAMVFSVNQVDRYLRDHHIRANFHVMLDGRPDLIDWVVPGGVKLYASMCDPPVLEQAALTGNLTMWHALNEETADLLGGKPMIGGGETVGTRALALAYVMGFRRIFCIGFDSCYTDAAHHAYLQALNDADKVIDVIAGGKRFKAAPWMAKQAEDFHTLSQELVKLGVELTVFGDGLIANMIRQHAGKQVVVEGFEFPDGDSQTANAVFQTLADLDHYVALCKQRRQVLQAGGNVGVWARHLAQSFNAVVTAEPDEQNWHCLVKNLRGVKNISAYQAALGAKVGKVGIAREAGNCGASYVVEGCDVSVITIDSLGCDQLDLLILDIEGYEFEALQGAKDTLRQCSPVIVLEMKDHIKRFGAKEADIDAFLGGLGYHRTGVAHRDVIYQRNAHA